MTNTDFENTGTTEYSRFIHKSRYARWLPEQDRRETWAETVDRFIEFMVDERPELESEIRECRDFIYRGDALPSMRALMTAGPAAKAHNCAMYNCSYIAVDSPRAFDEALYVLCCGTGLGFSVERQFINKLPDIAETMYHTDTVIVVADSKIGWAKAFRELISLLYAGQIPKWDVSRVRLEGSPLKKMGGKASGPAPLVDLFSFAVRLFQQASGRKLTSIECHDLLCKVASIVVVGGVRRSATISLSNPSDDRMRLAKSGQWFVTDKHRALANNSAAYTEKPDFEVFLKEWQSLYESKSGERGFFSRFAAKKTFEKFDREWMDSVGLNPCGEIFLRPQQFCNLTMVTVRPEDTITDLKDKVRIATILGTLQASFTNFKYLRKSWKRNCEEEALLGVSLTGVMDHDILSNPDHELITSTLSSLRDYTVEVNAEMAAKLGIKASAAITTQKPAGNSSQLLNVASGIHARFAPYYIRRVRVAMTDPIAAFMASKGFYFEEDVINNKAYVFEFPVKSPENAIYASDLSALDQLKVWQVYKEHWCHHNPSCTVYYKESEFLEVGSWLWNNFDIVSGVSFLPFSDHVYQQAPYEEITQERYEALVKDLPTDIDWAGLADFEKTDHTIGARELQCSGSSCENPDLV